MTGTSASRFASAAIGPRPSKMRAATRIEVAPQRNGLWAVDTSVLHAATLAHRRDFAEAEAGWANRARMATSKGPPFQGKGCQGGR